MKKIILFSIGLVATLTVSAQEPKVKPEGAHQSEYNARPQGKDDSAESEKNGNDGGESVGNQNNFDDNDQPTYVETPAGQSSSSPSGSPAVKIENAPDGTNTMQSAKPNIAGSPIPGSAQARAMREKHAVKADTKKAQSTASEDKQSKAAPSKTPAQKAEVKAKKK